VKIYYYNSPRDKSSEVILAERTMSFAEQSVLVSQNLIFLSKCPLIIVEPEPSVITKSLQLEPANLVSVPVGENDTNKYSLYVLLFNSTRL
jgi:hypothetical protein